MKILRNGFACGIVKTALKLGTTPRKIKWLTQIKKIKPMTLPIGARGVLAFSPGDQKIIKAWENRKRAVKK